MKQIHLFEAFQLQALGTEILVCSPAADDLADAVRLLVAGYEARFSRFRPTSEVELLSAHAGETMPVSEDLFEVLSLAAHHWRATGGIFDPLVRNELEAAGYDRSFELVPARSAEPAPAPKRQRPTFADVLLDTEQRAVRLPGGSRLDLGGIAKGWIVDRLAAVLEPYGPFLVDIGGDIVARGDGPDGGDGWLIAVADPYGVEQDCCWLRLDCRAIATSTTMRRRWRRDERWQHHLIDPRSGRPADSDIDQVTVVAPTAVEADVFAKTALILGRRAGTEWLTTRGLPALLLGDGESTPTPEWQPLELPVLTQ